MRTDEIINIVKHEYIFSMAEIEKWKIKRSECIQLVDNLILSGTGIRKDKD